jgi:hypothetical protein
VADEIASFLAPLAALQRLLARFDNRGIVIGGIATSLLAKPRLTADVDALFLVHVDELPRLIAHAKDEGFETRIDNAERFARRHRVLLLSHVESSINLDISLGILPFEIEAVERATFYQVGNLTIRLPTPEDLIIFKAVAHRPKDILDIQAIVSSHTDLDIDRIRFWIQQFGHALEMPELWNDIADLF